MSAIYNSNVGWGKGRIKQCKNVHIHPRQTLVSYLMAALSNQMVGLNADPGCLEVPSCLPLTSIHTRALKNEASTAPPSGDAWNWTDFEF